MLLFIALVYILLWCFLYSKKYMAWEVPSGYVRPTLMGPSCGGGDNDCPRCSSGHNMLKTIERSWLELIQITHPP